MIRHAIRATVAIAALSLAVLGPLVQAQDKPSTAQELADLRAIAESGEADAQVTLGLIYARGEGVPQDDAEAITWFRKAAVQGNAYALHNIGSSYANGRGVPQDDVEAVAWFRKAAEQGLADAQATLGMIYARGEGVPQDYAEAASWFREAAEQGHALAQLSIGLRYFTGLGVPQDDAEAGVWLRKAAEQGLADAQATLGDMYRDGRGVPQDDAEAVAWYRRAVEQGHTDAQARIEQMRAEQRLLQQQVTPTQASDPASLFQAQSVKCEWGQGTIVSWNEGRPLLEQGSFGKDAEIIFDSIDTQVGTARIIGNASAGDISVVETPVGLTFIEQATFGGMNFTTVFAHFVEPENVALAAVTSRHLSFASPFPSQYHGTCVILQ